MTEDATPTSDISGAVPTGSQGGGDNVQYTFMTAKTIRGREGATRTKWQNQGWEFVDQTQGPLRSELNFRKVKRKGAGAYLAQGYTAFRGLKPTTQKTILSVVGALVVLSVLVGSIAAALGGDDDAPETTPPAAQTEPLPASPEPTEGPSEEASAEPLASEIPEVDPYSYDGPTYEVVTTDENQGPAKLTQYWVVTTPDLAFSGDAYKDAIKLIIDDIAHAQGTSKFIAEVVTDKQIAEAESPSTFEAFIDEYGADYAIKTIPKLEKKGWVANYTGGFDQNTGKPSDDASAFTILWRPYATQEFEQWEPEVPVS
ncbi:hypothetical protein I601_2272 [Nocardioides dokdonensis FR1436]|uniref:Uncharacterized protein n=1 Tax=Nocardioides dokdonensis FR1436 TaxID=1300347 RepID=A0A1A9GKS9_9ACTN|nr:hypothetical protein [Nocardioides dokdonensis]ANH38696.1 hypothetical protein I601_2272 [Nocardioides dokdonensis FR1436]